MDETPPQGVLAMKPRHPLGKQQPIIPPTPIVRVAEHALARSAWTCQASMQIGYRHWKHPAVRGARMA